MKTIALALFVVCVVGSSSAQDCSSKFQDFHKCLADSHKQEQDGGKAKFEAMKAKIDACYTDNGCTAPAKPQKGEGKGKGKGGSSGASGGVSGGVSGEIKGNHTEGRECRKALGEAKKKQFQDCVKQAVPSFTFPQKDGEHKEHHFGGEHKGGFNHKEDNKQLDGCAKKEAVRDCKRALFNSSRPTEDEKKARFQANCNAKQTCLTALGADCQAQLEKFKQAACKCRQQQHDQAEQIRSSVKECANVQEKQGKRPQEKQGKQATCENKDYCQLGYDAFVQDHQRAKGGHH